MPSCTDTYSSANSLAGPHSEHLAPLTPVQVGILCMDRLAQVRGFGNLVTVIDLRGSLRLDALEAAFRQLLCRHALLRSEAVEQDGQWYWRELPVPRRALRVIDLAGLTAAAAQEQCERLAEQEQQRPFGLSEGWLRIILCRMSRAEWRLTLNRHHVATDGWSFALTRREVESVYNAYVVGGAAQFGRLPPQYWEYCRYATRQSHDEAAVSYWSRQLTAAPREVRFERSHRRAVPALERAAVLNLELPIDLTPCLVTCRVTTFSALLGTLALVLCRRTGQTDLPVGTDVSTRDRIQWEQVIGVFINRVVLRIGVDTDTTVLQFLQMVQSTVTDAMTYRHVPMAALAHRLRAGERHGSLFNVLFGLYNTPAHDMQLTDLTSTLQPLRTVPSELDLNLYFTPRAGGFTGMLTYREAVLDERWAASFWAEYCELAVQLTYCLQWPVATVLDWLEQRHGLTALIHCWEALDAATVAHGAAR